MRRFPAASPSRRYFLIRRTGSTPSPWSKSPILQRTAGMRRPCGTSKDKKRVDEYRPRAFLQPLDVVRDVGQGLAGLHVVGLAQGQVSQGDHAHHLVPVGDGQPPHLGGRHHPGGLTGVVLRGDHRAVAGHNLPHRGVGRVLLRRHAPEHNVPVGDNTPEPSVGPAHWQRADVVPGQKPGRQGRRLSRRNGHHAAAHQVTYLHINSTAFFRLGGRQGLPPCYSSV